MHVTSKILLRDIVHCLEISPCKTSKTPALLEKRCNTLGYDRSPFYNAHQKFYTQ